MSNRLRFNSSIDVIRWLTFQGCAFRGNNEGVNSKNRGNFLEMLKLLATYNEDVKNVVLQNAPHNATYTSPLVQKEILSIFANKVQDAIRSEIGDAKFCIIVDETRDESKREQMAIVLRFVDKCGFIQERFFAVVHVSDTTSLTLKNEICNVLSHHNLEVQSIRGQGYDGASNMRGQWNGLQALFLNDCPFAYYVHCLAHRLQLALVASAKVVVPVYEFFDHMNMIINIASSSCKQSDLLRDAQASEFENLIMNDEIETGKGLNQIGMLQRLGDTRWSSHLNSLRSMMKMYNAINPFGFNITSFDGYSERAFSAMSFVKNKLRNKMEDDFLQNYLVTYIEKEIAEKFDNDSIIEVFYKMKKRRSQLK